MAHTYFAFHFRMEEFVELDTDSDVHHRPLNL